jgi:endonuclease/exonuclease/phosphatase family metal-dependent hydrolase
MAQLTLRIVSWNVHGLPRPVDLHYFPWDRAPKHGERVRNVLERISTLSPAPDVIALQEVWRDDDAAQVRTLSSKGYEVFEVPNGPILRPTGLLTCVNTAAGWRAAQLPPVYYSKASVVDVDRFSHKGIQRLKVQRSAVDRFVLFNTHLQSQYAKSGPKTYTSERQKELQQLSERAVELQEGGVPLLACGDFNTYPYPSDFAVYELLSNGRPWVDLTKEARAECGCETNFDSTNSKEMDGWIDYALWAKDDSLDVRATVQLLHNEHIDSPYSDHQGMVYTVHVERRAAPEVSLRRLVALAAMARPTTRREWLMAIGALWM